ncbi:MAG: BON domain-containing protein [Armatimonadota bacterium]|nr:BON domain-containing protein [bacterium]
MLKILMITITLVVAIPAFAQTADNPCPVGGVPTVACPVINDQIIQATILSRLGGLVPNAGTYICVRSQRGAVTLTGYVFNDQQKSAATILASSVRGVALVDNKLCVSPLGGEDLRIAREISQRFGQWTFESNTIAVNVKDGVVQLSGYVQSEWAMDMAPLVAAGVRGVTAVYNNLFVRNPQSQLY